MTNNPTFQEMVTRLSNLVQETYSTEELYVSPHTNKHQYAFTNNND